MCEQGVTMVTTETHQSQDLVVPPQNRDEQDHPDEAQGSPSSPMAGFSSEDMSQGPVNAITVLTLLDKLVNMLDTVQENQNKMEVSQGWGHFRPPGYLGWSFLIHSFYSIKTENSTVNPRLKLALATQSEKAQTAMLTLKRNDQLPVSEL